MNDIMQRSLVKTCDECRSYQTSLLFVVAFLSQISLNKVKETHYRPGEDTVFSVGQYMAGLAQRGKWTEYNIVVRTDGKCSFYADDA